ncbi:hypothetical protein OESDEN_24111, partial [Oesophagostomum dentatum]
LRSLFSHSAICFSYFNSNARVVEVADTGYSPVEVAAGDTAAHNGGRLTVEEALDSIFQQTPPSAIAGPDTRAFSIAEADIPRKNENGPGIYSGNYMLMEQVMKQPSKAESLLKSEQLFVRCSYCHKTRELTLARMQYVTCKHCYTYYCSKDCRYRFRSGALFASS